MSQMALIFYALENEVLQKHEINKVRIDIICNSITAIYTPHQHSGKSVTIKESNYASGVCKAH